MNTSDFWERLKKILKTNNYTIKKLSIELGYNEKTYNVKITRNDLPTTSDIIRICEKFNVSADYLLLGRQQELPEEMVNLVKSILELPVPMQDTVLNLINNLKGVANGNTKK